MDLWRPKATCFCLMLAITPLTSAEGQRLARPLQSAFENHYAAVSVAPETPQRARAYVIAGAVVGAVVAGMALGPELHAAEIFPAPVAYGIPVVGGAVAGALLGRLVFAIHRSSTSLPITKPSLR